MSLDRSSSYVYGCKILLVIRELLTALLDHRLLGVVSGAIEMMSSMECNPFSRRASLRDKGLCMSVVDGTSACF